MLKVIKLTCPGDKLNLPPPIIPLTGVNEPGGINSTVVPIASHTARPKREPNMRLSTIMVIIKYTDLDVIIPFHFYINFKTFPFTSVFFKPRVIMGRLNVALLRYLSREDFRVLTAVS